MVWKVLLGLALLLAFLLFVPLRVQVLFRQGEVTARLRVLFLNVPLFPTPSGKEKAGRPKPAQGRPETEKKEKSKRNTLEFILDILRLVNDLLPHAGRGLGHILRRVTLSRCRVSVTVAQEDAADTALRYGQVNAAFYSVYALLCSTIRVREFRLSVTPDYLGGEEKADADLELRVRPSAVLCGGLIFVFRAGATLLKNMPARGKSASAGARPAKQAG